MIKKLHRRTFWIAMGTTGGALYAAIVLASGSTATRVLGQFDFTHHAANLVDAKGLDGPEAVAIDATVTPNRIYVADSANDRVLGWKNAASFTDGAPADLVIGQPDFISSECGTTSAGTLCAPMGVAVDGSGNLYVADPGNSRVLEYANPFQACNNAFPCVGGAANLVFGQGGSFTSSECDFDTGGDVSTADDLCDPNGVAVDASGNVYVADGGNNRVLMYNTPLSTDTTADTVFGQGGDFTSNDCDFDTDGNTSTAVDLCDPTGVALDGSGNLYVVDSVNERVLEFNTPFTGTTANKVFGQGGSFLTNDCNSDSDEGISSAIDLCGPTSAVVDGSGNLWVADEGNSRVLEYNTPLTTDVTADQVFGQGGDFTSNFCNYDIGILVSTIDSSTADDLCNPAGVAVDGSHNVYIADVSNNRVLEYNTPLITDTTADRVLGQVDFTHQMVNLTDAQGLYSPEGVAIDSSSTPNHIYITDYHNNRVLGWKDTSSFSNGAPADLVIGQSDFISYLCNEGGTAAAAGSLCMPEAAAVDGTGNLYVADSYNNRVLEYSNPFSACHNAFPCVGGPAILVLGQGASFTSNACDYDTGGGFFSPASSIDLCYPSGVAMDGSGDLYVADSSNSRVLEYNAPLSTGESASRVFGQGGSFTSKKCNFDVGSPFNPPTAIDLCFPTGVGLDPTGNLYVADINNQRVLEYNTPLNASSGETGAGDATADTVFGQGGSFASKKCNLGGISANSLCDPTAVAADKSGNVYIEDGANNRVLEFDTPLTTDTTADRVFGTCGSFSSSNGCIGVSADSLSDPSGVAVDGSGNLYVVDDPDNRVLEYEQPLGGATPTTTPTETMTPPTATATSTPTATPAATVTATGTGTPSTTASQTATATQTEASTPTTTVTATPSASATPTSGATPTVTATLTATVTPTTTPTLSATPTVTSTPTASATATATATLTATSTPTASATLTATATPTQTATPTATASPGPPHIVVNKKTLTLKAAPDTTASGIITISNTGTGPLIARVSALKHSPPFTELGGGSGITIGPGGSNNVTIMFSPKKKGLRTDQIVITSNDPKHKKPIKVKIKGKSK